MRRLICYAVILLVSVANAKEDPVYTVQGVQLIDLIRGRLPEDGKLGLTKVEVKDGEHLPDGIYYRPLEDVDLSNVSEDPKFLTVKNKEPRARRATQPKEQNNTKEMTTEEKFRQYILL